VYHNVVVIDYEKYAMGSRSKTAEAVTQIQNHYRGGDEREAKVR
jgi:hypothetical protein